MLLNNNKRTEITMETKQTPTMKKGALLTIACLGTALVVATATWGITTLAYDANGDTGKGAEIAKAAKATSSNIYSHLGTIPGSWVDFSNDENEENPFNSKFVSSVDGQCTYTVSVNKMKSAVSGIDGKNLSINKLMQTISNRDTGKAEFSSRNIATSDGVVPFVQLNAESSFDKGKGQTQKSKTTYLHYIFTEVPTADNEYPAVSMTYTCQDSTKWSEDELNGLIDATSLNINGQKFEKTAKQ